MAATGTGAGLPKRKRTDEQKKAKRESDRARAKTRVNLGIAFDRWRELRELKGMKSDPELALFLLDIYKSTEKRPPRSAACLIGRIEMEWDPNEETDSASEDDQMGLEEHDAESEEDDAGLEEDDAGSREDPSVSEEDEISEEDVNYHDDSDDEDYRPPINVQPGDGLNTSVHKFRDPSTADRWRKRQCEDAEEKLEATSSKAGEDNDVCEQINTTKTKDNSTAAPGEPVDKQNSHEKPSKKPPENPDQQERPPIQKIYECPTCGKVFPRSGALSRHRVIHSGDRPYKCFICARGFTQSGNLKTHMKVHKGEVPEWTLIQEAPKKSPIKAQVCGDCGMDFPDQQQLQEHRESHKWPYECLECGKFYKNEDYFKAHQRMHAGEVNFICSKCGKRWPTMASLVTHESTHNKKTNFRCKQCGKAYLRRSGLKQHLKAHIGELKYLCTVCGKRVASAHALKVHVRVHTGETPYTCDKCEKGFYYRQGLLQHLQTHDKKPKPPTKPLGRPKQLLIEVNS
uniref:Zinc finger protein 664-like n=1 Tax=Sphaeramia orbicularis TaxID=375764 RepID=A0A672YGK9_9TELE